MNKKSGFTLLELMVVVSIIAVLSGGLLFSMTKAGQKSRDTDRIADLRTVQGALELYKQKYGRYPVRCTNANPSTAGGWSGQEGTNFACVSGQQFIVGLAPEFIPVLPKDPKLNGVNSGYVYTTNSDGTVYKLMAKNSVESEVVTYDHELKSCDVDNTASTVPLCNTVAPSFNKPAHCEENNSQFQRTYAVWGGYANQPGATEVEQATEDVVCEIP